MELINNGIVEIKGNVTASTSCFLVSGNFGGGTLEIGYKDSDDNFIAFEDAVASAESQLIITHGVPIVVYARLVGGTNPRILIQRTSVY